MRTWNYCHGFPNWFKKSRSETRFLGNLEGSGTHGLNATKILWHSRWWVGGFSAVCVSPPKRYRQVLLALLETFVCGLLCCYQGMVILIVPDLPPQKSHTTHCAYGRSDTLPGSCHPPVSSSPRTSLSSNQWRAAPNWAGRQTHRENLSGACICWSKRDGREWAADKFCWSPELLSKP